MALFGKGNATGYLIPAAVGIGLGAAVYKFFFEPAEIEKQLAAQRAMLAQNQDFVNEVLDLGINMHVGRYNTTPYIQPGSTTEWNPENLNLSGSISDAGNGYTYVVPRSAI